MSVIAAIVVLVFTPFFYMHMVLAGSDTYPTSIAGCRYVSDNTPAGTCDLKDSPQDEYYDPWSEENRECTSYAAWMLSSVNGYTMPFHDYAINWGTDAQNQGITVNTTPAAGSVYWSTTASIYGHVAYVKSIPDSTHVQLEEYNFSTMGGWDERTVLTSSASGYIHFKDILPPPPLFVTSDYDDSTGLTEVFSAVPNGTLRETYWLYQQQPATNTIGSQIPGTVVDIASFVTANGWRHVYTATRAGPIYETVWEPGQDVTTWQIADIPNVVGIGAVYDASTGGTEVFSVDTSGYIRDTYWPYGQTPQTIGTAQLPAGTPTSVGAILYNNYRHVYVSTKEGPVTETVWTYGQQTTTWQVANVPNAVGVSASMSGTVTEVFTLDDSDHMEETYWDYGQQPQTYIVTNLSGTPSDLASFTTLNGYRHVYGATSAPSRAITETWWIPGQAATTWSVVTF